MTHPTKLSTIDAPIITDVNPFEFQGALLEAEFLDVLIEGYAKLFLKNSRAMMAVMVSGKVCRGLR